MVTCAPIKRCMKEEYNINTIMSKLTLLSTAIFCCISLLFLPVLGFSPAPAPSSIQSLRDSLHTAVNAAIDETVGALAQIKQNQNKLKSARESAALSDCSQLYELTTANLKMTLEPNPETTAFDIQIWLTAALTNLKNCKTSIAEMNITRPAFLDIDSASELINYGLTINAKIMKETGDDSKNPHAWFPDEDFLNLSEFENYTNIVVAKDGSGKYRTITEALSASRTIPGRVVIHIKEGEYKEYLEIGQDRRNLFLVGDGIGKTVITGDKSAASGHSTWKSATVTVNGDIIVFRGITFRNTAGPGAGQAVALIASSDHSAYYRCSFEGYQDTLCVNTNRQFFQECQISGTVDFIFGNAIVVINNSSIYGRKPVQGQAIVITAQGRDGPAEESGISIINSRYLPEPGHEEEVRKFKAALGRPWRSYARVVYMKTFLDGMLDPAGWWDMGGSSSHGTVYYAEYQNYGPGSSTTGRVKWKGYKVIKHLSEALQFTVGNFLNGTRWLPKTGVPFRPGF